MDIQSIIQEDADELLKIWLILKDMKTKGNGELDIIIRDGIIVNVKKTFPWLHKGVPFDKSDF